MKKSYIWWFHDKTVDKIWLWISYAYCSINWFGPFFPAARLERMSQCVKNFFEVTFEIVQLFHIWWDFPKKISFLSLLKDWKIRKIIKLYIYIKSELRFQKEVDYSFWQHLQLLTRGDRHKNMYLLYAWLGKHFLSKIDERMALCCFVKQSSSSTIK